MNLKPLVPIAGSLALGISIGWMAKSSTSSLAEKSGSSPEQSSLRPSSLFTGSEGAHSSTPNRRAPSSQAQLQPSKSTSTNRHSTDIITSLGEKFRQSTDPMQRIRFMDQLLSQLTPENALSIREFIKDLDTDSPEFEMFHYTWGQVAGKEALLFGLNSPEKDGDVLFRGWTSKNPEAAQEWFAAIDYENDPAFDRLRNRGFSEERLTSYLHKQLLHGLYLNDPDKAAQYLAALPADQASFARRGSEELIEDIIARNGIAAARDWVDLLPPDSLTARAVGEVADEWAERDPRAALDWAMTHQDEDVRRSALENVWRNMASGRGNADPFQAAEEINAMPNSTDKDSALAGYADGTRYRYPRTSVDAAMNITDPQLREESLIRNGGYYLRRDPQAANEWLNNSGFSEKLINKITHSSKHRR